MCYEAAYSRMLGFFSLLFFSHRILYYYTFVVDYLGRDILIYKKEKDDNCR